MTTMASQITSLTIVYPSVYSSAVQRKHQSSASLAFKVPVTWKSFHLMTSSCREDHHRVSPGWGSIWLSSHTGLSSTQYEQIQNYIRGLAILRDYIFVNMADDIFECISVNEQFGIFIKISLKFAPEGPIDNESTLGQIMAWRRTGVKPWSETMLPQFTDAYMWH